MVKWAYGCSAHFLNNFCEDLGKYLLKNLIKKMFFYCDDDKKTLR